MNISINNAVATVESDSVLIADLDQALDLLAACSYAGADKMIMTERQFSPEFFDLRTGLAGDVLQKFTQYGMALDIVGDFTKYGSNALQAFIRESNRAGRIRFVQETVRP